MGYNKQNRLDKRIYPLWLAQMAYLSESTNGETKTAWDTMGYTWMSRMTMSTDLQPTTLADLCPLTPSAVGSFPILRYTNGAFATRIQQQELHCDALNTRDLKSRNITPSF
jgi:hypothetical protein